MNKVGKVRIEGTTARGFEPVAEAFEQNFRSRGEVGANVCVYKDGKPVVDLWGGWRDQARTKPWEKDTMVCMMSISKGVTALGLWMLIDRGLVDLDAKVSTYWPEFAQNGKAGTTVKHLLGHRSGVFYFDVDPPANVLDWMTAVHALERQAPLFEPGSQGGYHVTTYGHLVGEIIRRVTGKTPGRFFRDELGTPLGLEYWIGVPEGHLDRLADTFEAVPDNSMAFMADPTDKQGRQFRGAPHLPDLFNSRAVRMAEWPAINGHGNGRAMGRLFGALANGGEIDGVRIVKPATVERLREVQWSGPCWMCGNEFRTALGFLRGRPNMPMGPNDETFATAGAGGSMALADTRTRIGFGYSPNARCAFGILGDRYESLLNAVYECV